MTWASRWWTPLYSFALGAILVTIGAWLDELADGGDGSPYGQLLGMGGVAYIAAVAYLRVRA
jgi:hypothetical protein